MPRPKRHTRSRSASPLLHLSAADIMEEVQRRREVLTGQLNAIRTQIAELASLGGSGPSIPHTRARRKLPKAVRSARRGRPARAARVAGARQARTASMRGNELSLVDRLHGVLRGKTMNAAQMAEAVLKAGHRTKSKRLRPIISQALLHHPERFRKVSRGIYTAR